MTPPQHEYQALVIGAGSAGIGVACALKEMGIKDFLVLEQDEIGASFKKWPKEMRFISPSFTGHNFKMPDLNAVTPFTSPAYSLQTEHPTGQEYAAYLKAVADFYEIPVKTKQTVEVLHPLTDGWMVETDGKVYTTKHVIWATGEFHYPKTDGFPGTDLCIHNTTIDSWSDLEGEKFIVIGGYESGIDAAVHLSKLGKQVAVLDVEEPWTDTNSDSSYSISPFTRDRLREEVRNGRIAMQGNAAVQEVRQEDGKYVVQFNDREIKTTHKPILATGFETSLKLVNDHFTILEDGYPQLTENDESTIATNLFLVGPQVKHDDALFCFIYKYRQRFAVVAETIANRLNINGPELDAVLEEYKQYNFYLRDLSCCSSGCAC